VPDPGLVPSADAGSTASSPAPGGVTVAIPVRNGGEMFARTLQALARQTVAHELLVCDSGSRDASVELARAQGARVVGISVSQFGHGSTRNLLMEQASGAHVAFLTQDAEPADELWLQRMLGGFALAADVGVAYGPYLPRPDAAPAVRLELERWFESLSPDRQPRVDRLSAQERPAGGLEGGLPAIALIGARGFLTDANACIARTAWELVPFREVSYAEDRVLAIDMLRAGFAKAFVPNAGVFHSHSYTPGQELRRSFDEWRALLEVYGWREPLSPARAARQLRGALGQARRDLIREGVPASGRRATLGAVSRHHVVRLAGALLGSRADRLPAGARRRLSLEGRASFQPLTDGRIDRT
jgi:GT2 family glycosyltransferase